MSGREPFPYDIFAAVSAHASVELTSPTTTTTAGRRS
jgi:hypothetical protein